MAQLKLVNSALNRHHYIEDWANWELADSWETPLQFLERSGDCVRERRREPIAVLGPIQREHCDPVAARD